MNFLDISGRVVAAGVLLVGLTGCAETVADVEAARVKALESVQGLRFVEPNDVRRFEAEVELADSVAQVERLRGDLEASDERLAEMYWECASAIPDVLSRGQFSGQGIGEGEWRDYLMRFSPDGSASLEVVGSAEMALDLKPGSFEVWLEANAGKVTGWSSDLADRVESRTLLERDERPNVRNPNRCSVDLDVTLVTEGGQDTVEGYFERGDQDSLTLVLDGVAFEAMG